MHGSESKNRAAGVQHDGPTQRASALAALSSAFNPSPNTRSTVVKPSRPSQGSQRAAAVAALSTVLTEEQMKAEEEASAARFKSRSPGPRFPSESKQPVDLSDEKEAMEGDDFEGDHNDEESEEAQEDAEITENVGECTFSYECLKTKSSDPVRGIDYKRREAYLSDAEFESVLDMTKETFYQQPKWKQDLQKKKVDLF